MPDTNPREQPGLPRRIIQCVQTLCQQARPYLPDSALALGGGTVLAARWSHRVSADADLFCPPEVFVATVRAHGTQLETALRAIADDPEQTFVDRIAVYTRIDNIEVTILPAVRQIEERTLQYVPGTGIETWSSANILAGKLLHRLYGGGVVEPRDLYDIATAAHRDPDALRDAVAVLTPRQLRAVCRRLVMLPEHWADSQASPLPGVAPSEASRPPEAIVQMLEEAALPCPDSAPGDPLEPGC